MAKTSVTLADTARRVGVSRAVVGRVLLGSGEGVIRVAEETAGQIRRVSRELGYRRNRPAQQLAGGRSHALGLVVAQEAPMVTFRRMEAIERAAAQHGLGYNNLEFSGLVYPALTTLDENHEAVAGHLVRLLVAGIQDRGKGKRRPAAEEVSVGPTLVVRESA